VSEYVLDDRVIGILSPAEAAYFSFSLCVQTGSGAHPASYPMVPGVLSPRVKRGRGVTLTTHPHPVPTTRMSRNYTSSPPGAHMGVLWDCFTFTGCSPTVPIWTKIRLERASECGRCANSLGEVRIASPWCCRQ